MQFWIMKSGTSRYTLCMGLECNHVIWNPTLPDCIIWNPTMLSGLYNSDYTSTGN